MASKQSLQQRRQRSLQRVRRMADWLDDAVRIPVIGARVGLDSILGLVPGIGDAAGLVLSAGVLVEGIRMQAPRRVLMRICGITAVDFCIGLVPIAGDLFDIYWKANKRNLGLLEQWLATETGSTMKSGDRTVETS